MPRIQFDTTRAFGVRPGDAVHIPNANGQWTAETSIVMKADWNKETDMIIFDLSNGKSFKALRMNQVALRRG